MSRSKRNKRAGGAKHWVMLEHYLMDTPAWRHLSANARAVYLDLKRRYNGQNNGLISYSAREAGDALAGRHHSTGARALLELQEHGFITARRYSRGDTSREAGLDDAINEMAIAMRYQHSSRFTEARCHSIVE